MNKIDEFYKDKETLKKLTDNLHNRVLFNMHVDESAQHTSITLRSPYVIDDLDITHQRKIYYKLMKLLEKERCDISTKICKELKEDLEEARLEILKDFKIDDFKKEEVK